MPKLMAANWKMFKTRADAVNTVKILQGMLYSMPSDREVLIFAPFTALESTLNAVTSDTISVGAQNFYPAQEGAFTGEISPAMLKDIGINWVLTGHSERRHIFNEPLPLVAQKTAYAIEHGMRVVLCIGEKLEEREAGQLSHVLQEQLFTALDTLPTADESNLVIAYEPVWAIGTGRVAGPAEILQAHAEVRKLLKERLGIMGSKIRILYGGSVKADNAADILALDNVDGVLVGGASLQAESFSRIVLA